MGQKDNYQRKGQSMPRNMSFQMTTDQVLNESKTVTRRFGWWFLKPGDILNACEKCMGLKKGEKINKLKTIRVVSTRPEPLSAITKQDCILEGFPEMDPADFVAMLTKHYKCPPDKEVNRIEFEYLTQEEISNG